MKRRPNPVAKALRQFRRQVVPDKRRYRRQRDKRAVLNECRLFYRADALSLFEIGG
jgi:hypothetical protein